ncbi:MAG: hypothetical protein ABIP41_09170 [Croceibacterium sp.]
MTMLARLAFAGAASLSLAACGSANDASDNAQADTVEMPADQALTGTPDPVANTAAVDSAAEDATKAAEQTTAAAAASNAEAAAADATAAADAAAAAPADAAKAR